MNRDVKLEGERLKKLLSEYNKGKAKSDRLTQERIAHDLDMTQGAISSIMNGRLQMTMRVAVYFAKALGVQISAFSPELASEYKAEYELSPSEAESNVAHSRVIKGYVPEISWVQAGAWTDSCFEQVISEDCNFYPRPPGASEECFALRVVGESMSPDYQPGWLIFVDPARAAKSGDDIVAILTATGEATFKRYIEEPGFGRMLRAINPAMSQQYIPINGDCIIAGVVVAAMKMNI